MWRVNTRTSLREGRCPTTKTEGEPISRRRLDTELVSRGLATSREHAVELIKSRRVTVQGAPALKPTRQVGNGESIVVIGPPPRFVSRAGNKLEAALELFGLDPTNAMCLDAGSSTGGFTDCLLQAGAQRVFAVDVGTGQLHDRLRKNPKVEVFEKTDIRSISVDTFAAEHGLSGGFDVVVADLSFISTSRLLPTLAPLVCPTGCAVVLVKPQFEAGRQDVSRGKGIISDPAIWTRVLHEFIDAATTADLVVADLGISPVKGGKGNVEFLALLRHGNTAPTSS